MAARGPDGLSANEWLDQNAPDWVQAEIEDDARFSLRDGIGPMRKIRTLLVERELITERDALNPDVVVAVIETALVLAAQGGSPDAQVDEG